MMLAAGPAIATWRIASVCTGIYGLAPTGLLDRRAATTHWRFLDQVQRDFPAIRMTPGCIYVEDGKFMTSGGVCAGIDLTKGTFSPAYLAGQSTTGAGSVTP